MAPITNGYCSYAARFSYRWHIGFCLYLYHSAAATPLVQPPATILWSQIGPAIRAHSAAAELAQMAEVAEVAEMAELAELAELGNTGISVFIGDSARIRSIFLV